MNPRHLAEEHLELTRRYFLGLGSAGIAGLSSLSLLAAETDPPEKLPEKLVAAIEKLEYITPAEDFIFYGRNKPLPDKLSSEKRREVGLERETWQLEVTADPENYNDADHQAKAEIANPLTKEKGNALNWASLMKLAEKHAVKYLKGMTCTNNGKICGMGLWEGVPLREVVWMAKPTANIRRVFYYGYHNDDPKQRFQSSLPIGRVLEDPPGEMPVILCYKLNDQWLSLKRGGPVRMIVPESYGNQSVKWLQHVVLTNNPVANNTYAEWNNDVDSPLKTYGYVLLKPKQALTQPAAITGIAQVGMSGLSKVQYWLQPKSASLPDDDPYFTQGDWKDAAVLPPPEHWGNSLPEGKLPAIPAQFDPATGKPRQWPLRNTIVHWAALIEGVAPGQYVLRCRTVDANGMAQPMPRPFPKSGKNTIQEVAVEIVG